MSVPKEFHCTACLTAHESGAPCPERLPAALPFEPRREPEPMAYALDAELAAILKRLSPTPEQLAAESLAAAKRLEALRLRDEALGPCDVCGAKLVVLEGRDGPLERCAMCAGPLETVPPTFRWARFGSRLLDERVADKASIHAALAASGKRMVVLIGAAGKGKTTLATAMFRVRADRGDKANLFAPAWRLGAARAQHGLGKGEAPLVERAMTCPILLIDDMGSERNPAQSAIPDIVFDRHEHGRPLWITTAMTRDETAAKYGDGIGRRVFERAHVIDCTGAA